MPPRANWKGYLKLSLVSCPIALFPATSSSERVSFRQVSKTTGNRLKQQLVDSGTGEPVASDDKGRGYEIGKNQYLMIEDDELESIQVESNRTIEIDRFVPRKQIDLSYLDSPYYIVPDDSVGHEAFAVIREAMRGKDMVAIGRVVMAKRERPIMLEAFGKGLRGVTLRYPYEVRGEDAYFEDIADVKVPKEMLELAEHILNSKSGDFEPSKFEDRYETALVEMLRQKQAGIAPKAAASLPEPARVINLMDALRRSIGQDNAPEAKSVKPAKAAGKKRALAKEEESRKQPQFKLPITGGKKKQVEESAKPAVRPAARKQA